MKNEWFKGLGWVYRPVSWQGSLLSLLAVGFCVLVFLAVDRHSHSASDTLYGVFPYFASCFLLLNWVASHTSSSRRRSDDGEIQPGMRPMDPATKRESKWLTVFVFAVAMAWVEAAVVYYLRTMIDRIEPHQPEPLPVIGGLGPAELVREAATLVMLLAVGVLAGKTWRSRLGYASLAFGVWDIFYYAFLKVLCGWPHSLLDWDILFLLPLPWWGPVLAPMLIALLMILWGTLVSEEVNSPTGAAKEWKPWLLSGTGAALALYLFMADCIRASSGGVEAVRQVLPTEFRWSWFMVALWLMAAPVLTILGRRSGLLGTRRAASSGLSPRAVSPARAVGVMKPE